MARFRDLPPEVLEEIMLWLPPESLKQFKLVQKSWYLQINALMNDRSFVTNHLLNMKRTMLSAPFYCFRYLKIVRFENKSDHPEQQQQQQQQEQSEEESQEEEEEIEEIEEEEIEEEEEEFEEYGRYFLVLANDERCDWDFIYCDTKDLREITYGNVDKCYLKVVTQCDGIICLASLCKGVVYLVNPSLREMRIVHCSSYGNDRELRGVGFGYDPRSDEYKVVALTTLPMNDDFDGPYKAEVYSLSGNSWREVGFGLEMTDFGTEQVEVYFNGVCYWCNWGVALEMCCFDLRDEVFRYVPLPDGFHRENGWLWELEEWIKLCVWKDSVVLFTYPVRSPKAIDMWILDSQSGGVEGSYSWTKHLRIGPLEGIRSPLGFWNDVELFLEANDGEIKLYNLDYEMVSHLPKHLDWFHRNHFVIHQKSLVSVLRKEGRRSVV